MNRSQKIIRTSIIGFEKEHRISVDVVRVIAATLVCSAIILLTSCSKDDNPTVQPYEYTGVPLIIMDTDIGSSTDDLFTMMMVYNYQEQKRSKLLGVVVDREGEHCAACADMLERIRTLNKVRKVKE
jgi:hypothetical protein